MKKIIFFFLLCTIFLTLVFFQLNCSSPKKTMTKKELIAKGKYLVNLGGCNDCLLIKKSRENSLPISKNLCFLLLCFWGSLSS